MRGAAGRGAARRASPSPASGLLRGAGLARSSRLGPAAPLRRGPSRPPFGSSPQKTQLPLSGLCGPGAVNL